MDFLTLVIFDLDGVRFGVDAERVRESVWLPELAPAEEAPPWVVGLFSLRGHIVPVADLGLYLGHPARRCNPSDQVVVLDTSHQPMGLIVGEVRDVIEIPRDAIHPAFRFEAEAPGLVHLVVGEVRVGDDLVTLLDASCLTALPERAVPAEAEERAALALRFCREATPEVRALFRARAMALRQTAADDQGARLGLAVVELGGERFGVELTTVQEFCAITQLSPIPCCPQHVLGAMNLRGDLVTLIEPHSALNLPPAGKASGKAMIARLGEQAMGIAVDDVHDVVYLRGEDVLAPPPALRARFGAEITGTAPYAGGIMTVLDLPALLARDDWIVSDTV